MSAALVLRIGAAVLGAIVLAQGVGKWLDLDGYRAAMEAFELFPVSTIPVVSVLWAATEVLAGVLLLGAATRLLPATPIHVGMAAATVIAIAYTLVNGITWARGLPVGNCTCFGVFMPQRLGLSVMIQDVVVLVWCGWLWTRVAVFVRAG